VVILANTSKQNNFQEIRKSVVFHTDLGFGAMLTDKKRRVRFTTLARTAIQSKLSDEMLSEELRVLYVALTRAREKLIITASMRNLEQTIEKLSLIPEGAVAPKAALALRSMIEWILVGVRGLEGNELSINHFDNKTVDSILEFKSISVLEPSSIVASDANLHIEADIYKEHCFSYPYINAVDLPSKLTVTGLKTLIDSEAETAPWVQKAKTESALYLSPSFLSGKNEVTATERGTLLHLVMQHIDYKSCSHDHEKENALKELQRLANAGLILDEQINDIDVNKILKFMSSALGGRMINAKKLEREFKFSILRPAEDYFPGGGSDKILLQGVVDCYFEENNEIVVVDFKTDKVTEKTVDKIAQQYNQQLNTYADALHHITGKHVKEKIIYFFSINHAYNLE
jgi:ATP-dependent helicase/nuclease subunit A